jgi:cation diffusion facilitator CzcD-associated flavoprotein CzcO
VLTSAKVLSRRLSLIASERVGRIGADRSGMAVVEDASIGETRIVIVGGGFAGVTLAEHLNRHVGRDPQLTVT